jgi:tRNA-specific 2-thiouridylase
VDPVKDQSYFLSGVSAAALACVETPLGGFTKRQVRCMASRAGLPNAHRKDSYGICFVGKRRLPEWLPQYVSLKAGHMVSVVDGTRLAEVPAVQLWTEGQGAKLGGMPHRHVVVGKNVSLGRVLVAPGAAHATSLSTGLVIPSTLFNAQAPPAWLQAPLRAGQAVRVAVRIRHRQDTLFPATVTLSDDATWSCYPREWAVALGGDGDGAASKDAPLNLNRTHMVVRFDTPQPFVSPGQIAALYHDKMSVCLGGGPIVARGVGEVELPLLRHRDTLADGVCLM